MNKKEELDLDGEIWKDIPDYEGLYEASNLGRIRTHKDKTTYTNLHGIRHWKSRIMKGRGNNYKTGKRVGLWKNGEVKDWLVARLIAITFLGKPKGDINTVNHINGNRMDNHIENLEWLTTGDNVRHAFDTGLMPYHKIRLFNKESDMTFRSMAVATKYIGRNRGYISLCLKKKRKVLSKDGIEFEAELLQLNTPTSHKI